MLERCTKCGESALAECLADFAVERGGGRGVIQDRRMRCAACGNVSYRGGQISAHEAAVAAKIREMDGLLSAEELRRIRVGYGFTQREMERILGTGPKTWVRWERGKVPHSKVADTLIRQMAADPCLVRRLAEQAGIPEPVSADPVALSLAGGENDRVRAIAEAAAARFARALAEHQALPLDDGTDGVARAAELSALRAQIDDLHAPIARHERLHTEGLGEAESAPLQGLGDLLGRARAARGLTPERLAEMIDAPTQQVRGWEEDGYRSACFWRLIDAAEALGLRIDVHVRPLQTGVPGTGADARPPTP